MKLAICREQDGQALVQVTLMLLVLMLAVALVVDVGHLYGQRRLMQNAADAGALAGARAMCLGYHDQVDSQAYYYAVNQNGADPDLTDISVSGNRVTVVARKPVDTYFIRVVGISTVDVGAEAEAACGGATSTCAVWPLAFDAAPYNDLAQMPCDAQFYIWVDDNWNTADIDDFCDKCECDDVALYGGAPMGSGSRGWLSLSQPPPEYPNPGDCGANCGEALKCWLEHIYSGRIRIGDCVPEKPGVDAAALHKAKLHEGDVLYVLLYDEEPCEWEPVGDCPGDPYHVAGFGRIEVIEVKTITWEPIEPYGVPDCPKNERVILATKICDPATSNCGGTDGDVIPPGGLGAVSLTR